MRLRKGHAVAVLVLVAALLSFTRAGLGDHLSRDESIYAYAGQQLAHGVAPYQSIFDPKGPGAQLLPGLGAIGARAVGASELDGMRVLFLAFACLAAVGVALLARELFRSDLAGLVAGVVFVWFPGFAADAIGGPDAKTPAIFFAVLALLLVLRRHWFWAGFAGALAGLVWQPLAILAVVPPIAACPARAGLRGVARAAAGAALPVAATVAGFALAGALPQLAEAAVRFPLTGIARESETLADRLQRIDAVVASSAGRAPFYAGLACLPLLLVLREARSRGGLRRFVLDPYAWVVATFVVLAAFPLTDFQGYPDLFPLLPFAALGLGGAAAAVVAGAPGVLRPGAIAIVAAALVAVVVACAVRVPGTAGELRLGAQRADAAVLVRLSCGRPLWSLGDPSPLVLSGRRNPDRYIYLGSGVDAWKIHHTAGGLAGWEAQIRAARPGVIVTHTWKGPGFREMRAWLRRTYRPLFVTVADREVYIPRGGPSCAAGQATLGSSEAINLANWARPRMSSLR